MAVNRTAIRFLLNDRLVTLDTVGASETLLDFLRLSAHLRGTKEGCAEGDCGACTVLVGRLGSNGLVYETVNACIRFVGSLDGCHVVTVEHLAARDGTLHPVQQAMVDEHGSQCGFCTPGIVMSLYALWMQTPAPAPEAVEVALQGNLCRCTGYESIIRAAQAISRYGDPDKDPLVRERDAVAARLKELSDGARVACGPDDDRFVLPASLDDLAAVMAETPRATIVAGATDVGLWVTKFMRSISPVVFIGHLPELHAIEESENGVTIGACVTYTELEEIIARRFPHMVAFWSRIGGQQVRNMGTVGGNIANGSPIGDTPPALIALGATVTLNANGTRRTVPLEDFFIAYGKQDRQPGDFVETVFIPVPDPASHSAAYKISKRRDEDISSVCGAFQMSLRYGTVADIRIAYGGMAATPKRAVNVERALLGRPWTMETVEAAMAAFGADFSPITDWRASAAYRDLAARNLLKRFYLETSSDPAHARLSGSDAA